MRYGLSMKIILFCDVMSLVTLLDSFSRGKKNKKLVVSCVRVGNNISVSVQVELVFIWRVTSSQRSLRPLFRYSHSFSG